MFMPTMYVHNVPESIYKQIQERAQAHNHSLIVEVINLLDYALAANKPNQAELLANIRKRRFFKPGMDIETLTLLRQDRER